MVKYGPVVQTKRPSSLNELIEINGKLETHLKQTSYTISSNSSICSILVLF